MNKLIIFGAAVFAILAATTYKTYAQMKQENKAMTTDTPKILVAYYSYSGNTKEVAEAIHEKVGGDIFEIKTEGTYPEEYRPMTVQAKQEIANNYRPKLLTKVDDISKYDVVFLGSPNWWGTITPQVSSFLESYDLNGKTVVPFITHGSGGAQNTIRDMTAQCKGCRVEQNGWAGPSRQVSGLDSWIDGLNLVP